jgi:hypothetical protein
MLCSGRSSGARQVTPPVDVLEITPVQRFIMPWLAATSKHRGLLAGAAQANDPFAAASAPSLWR